MTTWKQTLGTSLTSTGMFLAGGGIFFHQAGATVPNWMMVAATASGFVCMAAGNFFTHLFSGEQRAEITALKNPTVKDSLQVQSFKTFVPQELSPSAPTETIQPKI